MERHDDKIREEVRRKYAGIASVESPVEKRSCCGESSGSPEYSVIGDAYDGVVGYVEGADLGLGCGLPIEHAGLERGQTVLDLGSGAGLDVFVASSEVGSTGRVIGVDMTAEMIARARANAENSGFENVEFRLGEIEHLPVRSDTVDVVVSNCVLNLVPDKLRAFSEIYRVLKPGGHFCISDIVASQPLPDWVKGVAEAYAGCVAGAIPKSEYLALVEEAGFDCIEVVAERRIQVPEDLVARLLSPEQQSESARDDLHVLSITVRAAKVRGTCGTSTNAHSI
jgi:SAM-dependent methyltransferase